MELISVLLKKSQNICVKRIFEEIFIYPLTLLHNGLKGRFDEINSKIN